MRWRPSVSRRSVPHRRGFTLIEILIVVGMIAIVMAFGIPSLVESNKKGPMRQATSDLLEACREARASAIVSGEPAYLVISARGDINDSGAGGSFNAQLDAEIMFEMIDVNFQDMKQSPEVRVNFYPNGTSDEFTMLFRSSQQDLRKISLDVATALATLEVIR
jgi:type II secretion system protein H